MASLAGGQQSEELRLVFQPIHGKDPVCRRRLDNGRIEAAASELAIRSAGLPLTGMVLRR